MYRATIFFLTCLITITGCATPVYREVFQEKTSYNSKEFNVSVNTLYQASTRAICAKNFIIEKEDAGKGSILAKRSFQRGKRSIVLVLQAKMDSVGNDKTTLYLNALQTTEVNYVSDHTRFFLFLVPLPGGGGKSASQIKEGEKVIEDKKFYQDFFTEIQKEVAIVSANVEKGKSQEIAQIVEQPQTVSAPQAQKTEPQAVEVLPPSAPNQEKEETVVSER